MNYKIIVYNICKTNYNVNNLQIKQGSDRGGIQDGIYTRVVFIGWSPI